MADDTALTDRPIYRLGDRVHFTDIGGMEHDGTVISVMRDAPRPYLVKPDNSHAFQWTKWCATDDLSRPNA